jgi:aminoglycoside 3-N-acetyltransferase I
MPPAINITRLTAAGLDRYLALLRACGDEAAPSAETLANEHFWLLLAEVNREPAGALAAVVVPKLDARRGFFFIDELIVAPAHRRQGVATALLTAAEDAARALGLAGVRLLVRPENAVARALYARAGYHLSATHFGEKRFA